MLVCKRKSRTVNHESCTQRRAAHIIADSCLHGTNRTVAVKLIHNSL